MNPEIEWLYHHHGHIQVNRVVAKDLQYQTELEAKRARIFFSLITSTRNAWCVADWERTLAELDSCKLSVREFIDRRAP